MCMIRVSRLDAEGERVVTIVGRDAMDARVSFDERCGRGRQKRVVLTPQRQVLSRRNMLPPMTATTKPDLAGESTP
jgi:hypothetical protein